MSLLRRSSQPFRATLGFTLIELLSVIAVLGILASILIPTIGGARVAANKAKTRTQFSQWATAFEAFKQEYGNYPQFATNGAQKLVNPPGTPTQTTGNHLFHDLLAGTRRDGSALAGALTGNPLPAIAQNPRRIRFVSFTDDDFVLAADVTAGRNTNAQLNYVCDAFNNTSIAVITDSNLDGVINARDTTGGYPGVVVSGGTATIRPTTVVTTAQTGGIHAGVIFYCAPPGAVTENDLIMSWK
jgi:prepilin-type N-terminal cleavage/methylation domain-containing protein